MDARPDPASEPLGLVCPKCGCRHFETTHTERRRNAILRRKTCRHCGRKVVSTELLGKLDPKGSL